MSTPMSISFYMLLALFVVLMVSTFIHVFQLPRKIERVNPATSHNVRWYIMSVVIQLVACYSLAIPIYIIYFTV